MPASRFLRLSFALAFATPILAPAARAQVLIPAPEGETIVVTLNGTPIDFQGAAPVQAGGRVLVPLRGVFEALGAAVDYDAETRTIDAVRGATRLQLQLGSAIATINGQTQALDVPAQSRLGRTLVPLRFVAEALGANVSWDDASNSVAIIASVSQNAAPVSRPPVSRPPISQPPVSQPPVSRPPVAPPVVETPPYNPPADAETVSGTVVKSDATPPATLTLRVEKRLLTVNVDDDATISRQSAPVAASGATPLYGRAALLADIARLVPGEEVRATLDDAGTATQISSFVTFATARVRSSLDNQIVLDDARATTLVVGPSLRFLDARGRVQTLATLAPGQVVALFIAPGSRRIYQVSASPADVAFAANPNINPTANPNNTNPNNFPPDNTFPPDVPANPPVNPNNPPNNQFPPAADGAPVINLVQHNALRPLRNGGAFAVTVRGTEGARASFSVVPGAPEQPLVEDPNQPGLYTGTYVVRAGDNILNGRVTAFLRNDAGQEATAQSRTTITIDTVAPRITTTAPTDGATVVVTLPNIVVYANDIGGSGLAKATATINGAPVSPEAITVSPTSISITPLQPLAGQTTVRVNVADAANNSATTTFSFFANTTGTGALITSVTHNATRALAANERVSVVIAASEGGRASLDILGAGGRVVAAGIPATEISPGRYRATYTIQPNAADVQLLLRARFTDVAGRVATSDATAPVVLAGDTTAAAPVVVTVPLEGDRVASPLVIRGRATPNATVDVSVVATGVRLYVFEYRNDLGAQQVQANARGEWQTAPIILPSPNNVANLRYTISATQTDDAGRQSPPVTLSVLPR